jgi:hypothetical protein
MNAHDHEHATGHGERRGLTRRQLLLGGLGAGALGLLLPELGVITDPLGLTTANAQTTPRNRYRLAMHVHSSFSEGVGSMYAALAEARRTNHDLVFFTEHDHRKKGIRTRRGVHFTGPSEFEDPSGTWNWIGRTEGSPTARTQQWVTSPSSPVEPGHALRLTVTAPGGGATAMNGFDANDGSSGKSARCSVADQRIFIDVRVDQPSADAWLELRLHLSYYPDLPGYGRGYRTLSYRFGTQTGRSRDPSNPLRGIVWRAVPSGTWTTLELRPVEDIAAIFTELPVPADNATTAKSASENIVMTVAAMARNGATAAGWFDRLRFFHDSAGQATYDLQRQMLQQYGPLFPAVQARMADEISRNDPHLNWLTGTPTPISYDLNRWPAPPRSAGRSTPSTPPAVCSSTTTRSALKREARSAIRRPCSTRLGTC